MHRKVENMGHVIKTVVKVLDDRDGTELPTDTEPVRLSFAEQEWSLYLSENNLEELSRVIQEFTRNAQVLEPQSTPRRRRHVERVDLGEWTTADVRAWAVKHDKAKAVGRIPVSVQREFLEVHSTVRPVQLGESTH